MRVSRFAVLCVIGLIAALPVFAQQQEQGQKVEPLPQAPSKTMSEVNTMVLPVIHQNNKNYAKGQNPWTIIKPYMPQEVASPILTNTPQVDQLVKDGKLMLSLTDAISLALQNNLDLAIARYNLDIAETDILRAKSGGATRGVNTGLVSGTPGGGGVGSTSSGTGAGGTTTGSGGAGAGTGGIVSSTSGAGPGIDSFDPVLTGTLQIEHSGQQQTNPIFTGVPFLQQNTGTANFGYAQGFSTGTLLSLSFSNTRTTTNSTRTTLTPLLNSSFRTTIRQHLLSGCCLFVNRRNIYTAQNNKQIADIAFENQVISTVSQIQNIYWDLVNAYEDFRVKERSLALAQKTLSDNQKQVEIGTLAPIEITRAQSEVSTREQDLIISQTNLQLQQLLMKNAITRNITPDLATAPVIPTDTMVVTDEPVRPVQDLVNEALQRRPDINSQRIDLKNRDISRKAVRNALLPTLDLVGFYGGSGIAGVQNPAVPCGGVDQLPCLPTRGYGGAFGDLFDSTNPDKGVALQLTIPIRNRAAQADQARSQLEYRQAEMRLAQLQNQINIEVRNAQYAVTQNKARVDAARKARDLAQESLNAEQKKYALGASTNTLVLQAQRDLTQAEVNVVAAMAAYEKSRVSLDQVTGFTLERLGIKLDDAANANISQQPTVPGVAPAPLGNVTAEPVQQQPQQQPQQ